MKLFHLLLKCCVLLLEGDVPAEGRSRGLGRGEEVTKQTGVMKKRKRKHSPSCCGKNWKVSHLSFAASLLLSVSSHTVDSTGTAASIAVF